MDKINYFSAEEAILLHDIEVIEKIGGLHGVKDKGRVFSVFEHLQNDDYYPDFETKLTVLVFNTVQFHMFNDGNKRIALSSVLNF
ncbi:death-on-curing family protein [Streptococcus pneumoniae]|nr:death-on-curing family protein [Streptococcus pneumoniae]